MKNIIIEWKGSQYTIKSEKIFSIVERWEDQINFSTYTMVGWASDTSLIKPLKAARAFCIMLEVAGCKDYDLKYIVQGLHHPSEMQQGVMAALYGVVEQMMPPESFIQNAEDNEGGEVKKNQEV